MNVTPAILQFALPRDLCAGWLDLEAGGKKLSVLAFDFDCMVHSSVIVGYLRSDDG